MVCPILHGTGSYVIHCWISHCVRDLISTGKGLLRHLKLQVLCTALTHMYFYAHSPGNYVRIYKGRLDINSRHFECNLICFFKVSDVFFFTFFISMKMMLHHTYWSTTLLLLSSIYSILNVLLSCIIGILYILQTFLNSK